MTGAAHLAAGAAQRAGSGMVSLSSPGVEATAPPEVVRKRLPAFDWSAAVLDDLHRYQALVIGPGLGREEYTVAAVRATVEAAPGADVIDGDALFAMAWNTEGADRAAAAPRRVPTVLTPHDGEFGLLTGQRPGADRFAAARRLAADTRAVVLLKGPATVVADPGRRRARGRLRRRPAGHGRHRRRPRRHHRRAAGHAAWTRSTRPRAGAWIHAAAGRARARRSGSSPAISLEHLPAVLEPLG